MNGAGESPLFAVLRCKKSSSIAIDIAQLLVDEECDAHKTSTAGNSVLVAAQCQQTDPALLRFLSSLLNVTKEFAGDENMCLAPTMIASLRPRRPRLQAASSLGSDSPLNAA